MNRKSIIYNYTFKIIIRLLSKYYLIILLLLSFTCRKKTLLIEKIYNENSKFIKMIGKIKLKKKNGKNLRAKFQIRIKKNKLIWISISAAFGIEVLRITITKYGVTIVNKQEKTYTYYSYKELKDLVGFYLNLKIIQKILLAQKKIIKGDIFNKEVGNPFIIETILSNNIITNINLNTGRVEKILLQNKDKINGIISEYKYKLENTKLPYESVRIDVFRNDKNLDNFKVEIKNLKTISLDEPLEFPFDLPDNYEIR